MKSAVYSIPEVAMLLGISQSAAYDLAAEGSIPCIRLGRRVLVPKAKINEMLGFDPESDPQSVQFS